MKIPSFTFIFIFYSLICQSWLLGRLYHTPHGVLQLILFPSNTTGSNIRWRSFFKRLVHDVMSMTENATEYLSPLIAASNEIHEWYSLFCFFTSREFASLLSLLSFEMLKRGDVNNHLLYHHQDMHKQQLTHILNTWIGHWRQSVCKC